MTEQGLYTQVVMLPGKDLNISKYNRNKNKINISYRVSQKYRSVGLILILIGLRTILARVKPIYICRYSKGMMKHKIQIYVYI